jgi:hypothetical protein
VREWSLERHCLQRGVLRGCRVKQLQGVCGWILSTELGAVVVRRLQRGDIRHLNGGKYVPGVCCRKLL